MAAKWLQEEIGDLVVGMTNRLSSFIVVWLGWALGSNALGQSEAQKNPLLKNFQWPKSDVEVSSLLKESFHWMKDILGHHGLHERVRNKFDPDISTNYNLSHLGMKEMDRLSSRNTQELADTMSSGTLDAFSETLKHRNHWYRDFKDGFNFSFSLSSLASNTSYATGEAMTIKYKLVVDDIKVEPVKVDNDRMLQYRTTPVYSIKPVRENQAITAPINLNSSETDHEPFELPEPKFNGSIKLESYDPTTEDTNHVVKLNLNQVADYYKYSLPIMPMAKPEDAEHAFSIPIGKSRVSRHLKNNFGQKRSRVDNILGFQGPYSINIERNHEDFSTSYEWTYHIHDEHQTKISTQRRPNEPAVYQIEVKLPL